MKIELYVDVWPGMKNQAMYATDSPMRKSEGCKRYKIVANIPDYAFTGEIDGNAPVNTVEEVDKNE